MKLAYHSQWSWPRISRQREKAPVLISVVVAVILSPFGILSCTSNDTADDKAAQTQITNDNFRDYPALANMVSTLNVDTEWNKQIKKISVFSIDVEAALKNPQRPILFISRIDDIESRDGAYLLHFTSPQPYPEIVFVLKSNSETAQRVHQDRRFVEYAVVASISSVKRMESLDSEGERIERFVAEGECRELLPTSNLQRAQTGVAFAEPSAATTSGGRLFGWLYGLGGLAMIAILIFSLRRILRKSRSVNGLPDADFQRVLSDDADNAAGYNAIKAPSPEQRIRISAQGSSIPMEEFKRHVEEIFEKRKRTRQYADKSKDAQNPERK